MRFSSSGGVAPNRSITRSRPSSGRAALGEVNPPCDEVLRQDVLAARFWS